MEPMESRAEYNSEDDDDGHRGQGSAKKNRGSHTVSKIFNNTLYKFIQGGSRTHQANRNSVMHTPQTDNFGRPHNMYSNSVLSSSHNGNTLDASGHNSVDAYSNKKKKTLT